MYYKISRRTMKCITKKIIVPALTLMMLFGISALPHQSFAQSSQMYPAPSKSSVTVGDTVSVPIIINPNGESIDTVRAVVSYSADIVQITNFSQGSTFPGTSPRSSYDNQTGLLDWGGFTTASGGVNYAGTFGTITFKAIKAGTATITVTASSHLISSGQESLATRGSANIVVKGTTTPTPPAPTPTTPPTETPTPTTPPTVGAPKAPYVYSATHPDQDKWYTSNKVAVNWSLEKGVTGVSMLMDKLPWTDPGPMSDGLFSSHTYLNVADGISFFHVKTRNEKGWSLVSHYRIKIDTTVPAVTEFNQIPSTVSTQARLNIVASDTLSGMKEYTVSIDGGEKTKWVDDGSHIYTTPDLEPGTHTIVLTVVDAAGNSTDITKTITIEAPKIIPTTTATVTFASSVDNSFLIWLGMTMGGIALTLVLLVLLSLYGAVVARQKREVPKKKTFSLLRKRAKPRK